MQQGSNGRRQDLLRHLFRRREFSQARNKSSRGHPTTIPFDRVSAAVHDLKNPICSILNLTEVLLSEPTRNEEDRRKMIELIQRLTRQMSRLARQILPYEAAGRNFVRIDVDEVLKEAVALLQPMASERGIRLEIFAPSQICAIRCDKDEILRVFSNLIGNAVQFSDPGTVVKLRADSCSDEVVFEVEDQGCGIASEHLNTVFEKYWRGDPKGPKGMGLGLHIAREIVQAHGGSIRALQVPGGKGSVLVFTLPICV